MRLIGENKIERLKMKTCDKPLADKGLTSYRCKGAFGWIMIGAKDCEDAMREALRSSKHAMRETLQVWNGIEYTQCV